VSKPTNIAEGLTKIKKRIFQDILKFLFPRWPKLNT